MQTQLREYTSWRTHNHQIVDTSNLQALRQFKDNKSHAQKVFM